MCYRGPSTNRPAISDSPVSVTPWKCPLKMGICMALDGSRCPRFGRLRSSGEQVVCLDSADAGPTLAEVLDCLET